MFQITQYSHVTMFYMEQLPMEALITRLENGEDREQLISEWGVEMVVDAEDWIELSKD